MATLAFWQKMKTLFVLGMFLILIYPTAATPDFEFPNVTLTNFTFGSCHKREYQDPRIWQRIKEQHGQAWLWLGDAVYPPMRKVAPIEVLKDEYQALLDSPAYKEFRQSIPYIFGIYDDHDFGGNDMGKDMPEKEARRDAFWEFLGYEQTMLGVETIQRQGVYHSVSWGEPPWQAKIVFLDTRTFRDDHCGIPSLATHFPLGAGVACLTRWLSAGLFPSYCRTRQATMLGPEQWAWLEEELLSSTASLNIVVSSVQVLSTNPV
jgi:alkaline phosphatase D